MGTTLYISYYPKECNNPAVIPYLKVDKNLLEFNGKYMPNGFYDACKAYGIKDELNDCYIFECKDKEGLDKLFGFAGLPCVPEDIIDYIIQPWKYDSSFKDGIPEDGIFVIWVR